MSIVDKKELTPDIGKDIDDYQVHYAKWKKLDSTSYIIYDFICITFWKRQNYNER